MSNLPENAVIGLCPARTPGRFIHSPQSEPDCTTRQLRLTSLIRPAPRRRAPAAVVLLILGIAAFFFLFSTLTTRRFNAVWLESAVANSRHCAEQEKMRARHAFVSMVSDAPPVSSAAVNPSARIGERACTLRLCPEPAFAQPTRLQAHCMRQSQRRAGSLCTMSSLFRPLERRLATVSEPAQPPSGASRTLVMRRSGTLRSEAAVSFFSSRGGSPDVSSPLHSHPPLVEVRTPASSIVGALDLLVSGGLTPAQVDIVVRSLVTTVASEEAGIAATPLLHRHMTAGGSVTPRRLPATTAPSPSHSPPSHSFRTRFGRAARRFSLS